MHNYEKITKEFLRELFDYDESRGELIWKNNKYKKRNGKIAGTFPKSANYKKVKIDSVPYQLHRLIWIYHNGNAHVETIDHIDRDKKNNRIENLRAATQAENIQNVGIKSTNKSGRIGVFASGRKRNPWRAQITVNGKKKYLGIFSDKEEASLHAFAAAQCLGNKMFESFYFQRKLPKGSQRELIKPFESLKQPPSD